METFSLSTRIPTSARDAVWTLVRNDIGFRAWQAINASGIKTRDLTKTHLVAAVADLGLNDAVMTAIANGGTYPAAKLIPLSPADAAASADDIVATGEALEPEDDIPEGFATAQEANIARHAENILSELRPFLAPALLVKVEAGLAPLVTLANKPAVEVERIVTVEGAVTAPASGSYARYMPAQARQVSVTTLARAFGLRGALGGKECGMWDAQDAPQKDPAFTPDPSLLAKVVSAIERGHFVWLTGPAGTGKTSLPMHIAAVLHRPFVRIPFERRTDPVDLIGSDKLIAPGVMGWVDGMLTAAIRRPGTIILLDEPTLAPGLSGVLQTLLDMRFLTLPTGEVVKCAKGVYFLVGDNTRGYGDESGRYAGTAPANAAFIDRFARMITVDYLDVTKEAQALVNHTGAPRAACERVAQFVKLARDLPGFGTIPLSLRRMTAFVVMAMDGFEPAECFADTFETRLAEADRETLRQAWRAHFDAPAFAAELSGAPVPAAASNDPAQVSARAAFDPQA